MGERQEASLLGLGVPSLSRKLRMGKPVSKANIALEVTVLHSEHLLYYLEIMEIGCSERNAVCRCLKVPLFTC